MKSAKEKAAEVCRKLGLPVDETENGVAYQIILVALQKHEADTRYACGEAIRMLPKMQIIETDELAVEFNTAWMSCMNAKVE